MNKSILILGLGKTGVSLIRFFTNQGITPLLVDSRIKPPLLADLKALNPDIECQQADQFNPTDYNLEVAYASPGFPLHHPIFAKLNQQGVYIANDIELFVNVKQTRDMPGKKILAVTGTNGKSTVCSMLEHTLTRHGTATIAAGNIGKPVVELLESGDDSEVTVLELSSFQLSHINSLKNHSGCILNLAPDHLDKHKTLEEYAATKQHIYHNSSAQICNSDAPPTWVAQSQNATNIYWFGLKAPPQSSNRFATLRDGYLVFDNTPLIQISKLANSTAHNQSNALACIALLASIGKVEAAVHLASYKHLKHRCEYLGKWHDRHFINDSKATNPDAAIKVIEGLAQYYSRLIIIAGGDAKNLELTEFADTLQQYAKGLVVMGKDAAAIAASAKLLDCRKAINMQQATQAALDLSQAGDCIALCPGCASTDMYRDYQQRGDEFIASVQAL